MKVGTKIAILKITIFLGIILILFHKLSWGLALCVINLILRLVVFCRCPHCGKWWRMPISPGPPAPTAARPLNNAPA